MGPVDGINDAPGAGPLPTSVFYRHGYRQPDVAMHSGRCHACSAADLTGIFARPRHLVGPPTHGPTSARTMFFAFI